MSDEPTPITPDASAGDPQRRSRGFWRRDALIWGAVLLAVALLAWWRFSTTGRGPEDADRYYPGASRPAAPGAQPPTGPAAPR